MITYYTILDTNIYRSLGLKFSEHPDYINLNNFIVASGGEFLLSEVVAFELLDYFEHEVLNKTFLDLRRTTKKINENHYIETKIQLPDLNSLFKDALSKFKKELYEPHFMEDTPRFMISDSFISLKAITSFILDNKRNSNNKENTRDYLIWESVIYVAKRRTESKVILISKDNIFQDNKYFQKRLLDENLRNIEVFTDIPNLLKTYGFQIDFLTNEMILEKISEENIKRKLTHRPGDMLSYVSECYNNDNCKSELIDITIESIEMDKFYTYKEFENDMDFKYKFISHILVRPKMIYQADKTPQELKEYLESTPHKSERGYFYYLETYDEKAHPIYNEKILFLYGGELDLKNKRIKNIRFYDFFPDHFELDRMRYANNIRHN